MQAELQPLHQPKQAALSRSGHVSLERLINCYVVPNPEGAPSPASIHGSDEPASWTTVGAGPIRGMVRAGQYVYVVSGPTLYRVDSGKGVFTIGGIAGSGVVRMIASTTQVLIAVPGSFVYVATPTTLAIVINVSSINGMAQQDGYGFLTQQGTDQVWATNLDDLDTVAADAFTTADAFTDLCMGCASKGRNLVVFKEETIELLYNAGLSPFPFVRGQPGVIERGCYASGSISADADSVRFLGNDRRVYELRGYEVREISTPQIAYRLAQAYSPESAEAITYSKWGHTFYVLSLSYFTVVYDTTTGLWHERKSTSLARWGIHGYVNAFGKHLVGDHDGNTVYALDDTQSSTEYIPQIVMAPLFGGGPRVVCDELYVDIETGTTNSETLESTILLDWSEDDGRTWVGQRTGSLGSIGGYGQRLRWTRLGSFYRRTFRLTMTGTGVEQVGLAGVSNTLLRYPVMQQPYAKLAVLR